MAPRIKRDDLDKFFDHGIDLGGRTIYFGGCGEIDEHESALAVKGLHLLDRSEGEITVKICSPGGDWYAGMAIYDAIAGCKNPVRAEVYGMAMSMAAIILQAADTRALAPSSTVMIHYPTEWFVGHTKDLERRAMESARCSANMENIFLNRIHDKLPDYTREQFKQKFSFDVFMSAQEAIDFGLADEIL